MPSRERHQLVEEELPATHRVGPPGRLDHPDVGQLDPVAPRARQCGQRLVERFAEIAVPDRDLRSWVDYDTVRWDSDVKPRSGDPEVSAEDEPVRLDIAHRNTPEGAIFEHEPRHVALFKHYVVDQTKVREP